MYLTPRTHTHVWAAPDGWAELRRTKDSDRLCFVIHHVELISVQAYFIDILESRQVDHLVDGTVRLEHNNTVALSPFVRLLRLDHEEKL